MHPWFYLFPSLFVVSAESKVWSYPYPHLFSSFGYNRDTKWQIWPFIRKQCEPFPGVDLISAPTDLIALSYTGYPGRNVPDFGRVFLMLKYADITQNTYVQSWTVTEIMTREVWNSAINCFACIPKKHFSHNNLTNSWTILIKLNMYIMAPESHLNGVSHKSLQSVIPTIRPLKLQRRNLTIARTRVPVSMKLCKYISCHLRSYQWRAR
jgi:hypothetical protein